MSSNRDLAFRPFQQSDLPEVLELFELAFKQRIDERTYRWFFMENPYGRTMTELALDGEKIVGHYAVCPALSSVYGQDLPSARSMTTMTHPEYGGRGIFTRLAERLYERIRDEDGVACVWGFPNRNSHYGFIKNLQWRDLFCMHFLDRDLADRRGKAELPRELSADETAAAIAGVAAPPDHILPYKRDARFVRWRFADCPHKAYRFLGGGGAGSPVAVVSSFRRDGVEYENLVDVLGPPDPEPISRLLQSVLAWAAEEGAARLSLWVDLKHPLYAMAEKQGFQIRGDITYYGLRPLISTDRDLTDPRGHRVSMSDSDVF